jgi:hypothetical protein
MNMKPAITITATILVSVLAAGLASAQSPSIIQNARETMNGVSNKQTAASNEALGVPSSPAAVSVTHGPVSSHPVIARTPVKSSVIGVRSGPASGHKDGPKRVSGVGARRHEHPKAAVVVSGVAVAPQSNSPAASPAGNSVSGTGEGEFAANEQQVVPDTKYAANGRRDPFISPVVSHSGGSGCSTGKKCLEIGAINLRGVVHAESGFIAVVSNGMNKAYFLRENDPVFNGYVVKITGDSIVFQETLQDRLGKTFTREVVKKITTPAV